MILQQTLSRREKSIGMVAVSFLVGLVFFGYNQTVIIPAKASILHTEKIGQDYSERYSKLTEEFNGVRENINSIKSASVKSKLRSIKGCMLEANQKVTPKTALESCEALFVETETAIDTITLAAHSLEITIDRVQNNVQAYEHVVDQALAELKKKNAATLGKVEH